MLAPQRVAADMGRGILVGAIWGFVVGTVVLAASSLLTEVPGRGAPDAASLEVPAGSQFDQAGVDRPVPPPTEDAPIVAETAAPSVNAPLTPVAPSLNPEITAPAAVPQTSGVGELSTPPAGASDSGVTLQAEIADPGGVGEPAAAPTGTATQESDAAPSADTAPAPEIVQEEPASEPAPEEPAAEEQPPEAVPAEAEPAEAATEAPVATPSTEPTTEQQAEQAAPAAPRPQASAGGFGNLAPNVTVNRPTEGGGAETPEVAEEPEAPKRALEAFAGTRNWEGPDGRPLLSIVVIDEAGDASRMGALNSFKGPLTFAVPADAPGAAQATRAYREAGHEVVLLADIPAGAQPSDVEVAMQSFLAAVPEAVAVLDGSFDGFGGDRQATQQVVEILEETGHGLLTVSQGLNTAQQIADRAGVPAATVFRDLDREGQGNTVIRRFLDQAAFRAGQEGQLVLLARTKAETISALLIWAQQERAGRVMLAPLSAVLLAQDSDG